MNLNKTLRMILAGYAEKGRSIGLFLIFLLTSAAVGSIIVLPMWKFSTSSPKVYSITILIIAFLILIFYIVNKLGKVNREKIIISNSAIKNMRKRRWLKAGKIATTLVSLYILIIQFTAGAWLRGLILFIVLFFLLGWMWFGNRDGKRYQPS
ncbi:MAG: hypothetical protein JEY99_20220 [Spirochaetales bacterium]|nr:hypothetical protein [Spirochaetales bacterium]